MSRPNVIFETLAGVAAGFLATVPMSVAMLCVQRMLPRKQQSTLEPRRISDDMLRRADLHDDLTERHREGISVVAHFGYGAATGIVYTLVARKLPVPKALRGPAYGLMVWTASYAGWLPAIGTLPPPQHRPGGRNLLLIVSHLIWGTATETVSELLLGDKTRWAARRR